MHIAIGLGRVDSETLGALLAGLTALNAVILSRNRNIPPLYKSGVRYRREKRRREDWNRITIVRKLGWGDCEDLAAWRAAELQMAGEAARAIARPTRKRGRFHAVVLRENGSIEDPSRKLGMGRRK